MTGPAVPANVRQKASATSGLANPRLFISSLLSPFSLPDDVDFGAELLAYTDAVMAWNTIAIAFAQAKNREESWG